MYEDAGSGAGILGLVPGRTQRISEGGGVTISVLRSGKGSGLDLPGVR